MEDIKLKIKTSEAQKRASKKYILKNRDKQITSCKNYYLSHKDDDEWMNTHRINALKSMRETRQRKREKILLEKGYITSKGRPKKIVLNLLD